MIWISRIGGVIRILIRNIMKKVGLLFELVF